MLFILLLVVCIGLIGFTVSLIVRQMLERRSETVTDGFEARVLDELEILRTRLDAISEKLGDDRDPVLPRSADGMDGTPLDSPETERPGDAG